MREIKFRGLRTDNSQMIVGQLAYFFDNPKNAMIMPKCYYGTRDFGDEDDNGNPVIEDAIAMGGYYSVKSETVGQFTGLHDKNRREIYEGDELFVCAGYHSTVQFQDGMFVSVYKHPEDGEIIPLLDAIGKDTVVIGNIHENPELIQR